MTKVDCIRVVSTGSYIGNLLTACIDTVLNNLRTAIDSQSITVHNSITGSYAVQTFQVLSKADFQVVAAVRYDADVIICRQFAFIRNAADDVHLFIQFLLDNRSRIAAVLHAVVHGSNFMCATVLIFNDETRDIGSVKARFSVTALDGESVSAVFAIQTDRAVFTVNHHSGTVFTVNSDGAVFAVSAFFTEHQIIIHIDFVRIVSRAIAFHGGIFTVFQDCLSCCNSVFQLTKVDCIRIVSTGRYIGNLLTACVNTILNNLRTVINGQSVSIHNRIAGGHAGQVFQILGQFHIQRTIFGYYANIAIRQFGRISTAFDIQLFAQFLIDDSCIVTLEAQAFGNGVIDICNISLVGFHAVTDRFQLVFRCRLSVYDCRVVNIPCTVSQFVHCAGTGHFDCSCLDIACRAINGYLISGCNLTGSAVYNNFLIGICTKSYLIT